MLKVKYTRIAIQDLNAGYDYIYHEKRLAAKQVIERIEQTINYLKEQPFMGRKGRVEETYEVVAPNTSFIIVYQVSSEWLFIVSILHTARKYP